jgi:hypothetical protein
MTLADFQPYVEDALIALEWATARARWRQALHDEEEAIRKALLLAGQYGVEPEPLEDRLRLIALAQDEDVTADCVPQHPVRSIPIDMITAAVIRRILKLPPEFPVLSIKVLPAPEAIADALQAIAMRWSSPNGASGEDAGPIASHV